MLCLDLWAALATFCPTGTTFLVEPRDSCARADV